MALKWVRIANLKGPAGAGDAAALIRFNGIDEVLARFDRTDYVKGNDRRALQHTTGDEYALAFTDRDGYVAGGFTSRGRLRVFKPMDLPDNTIQPSAVAGMVTLDPSTGYVSGAIDPDGYMSFGVRTNGSFRVFKGDGGVASRAKIAAFGDSLTRGYTNADAWDIADSWPSILSGKLPGVEVANLGYGGNTADEIRFRTGAIDLYLTSATGYIPATGSVAVTTKQKVGFRDNGNFSAVGYLAGIYGTFRREPGGAMSFTRTSDGVSVPVPSPSRFVVLNKIDYRDYTAIIWLGRNDVSYAVKGAESTVAEHVVASNIELVEWLSSRVKQVIVVGATNRVDEPRGTTKYNTVIEINERLAQLFPGKYMDVRTWLVNQAIYDAGMTPTEADLDAISKDTPPPQIMDGGSHYNKPIAPLLADLFYARLTEKGYI